MDRHILHEVILEISKADPGGGSGDVDIPAFSDEHSAIASALPNITVDHGSEFTSRALDEWVWRHGGRRGFITPGRPMENRLRESLNGRLPDECINVNEFVSPNDAKARIEIVGPRL